MATKDRLVLALHDAHAPTDMIDKARQGYYDDYESDIATPIVQLVRDCEQAGLTELAQRAKDGEFDGSVEEAEAWYHKTYGIEAP